MTPITLNMKNYPHEPRDILAQLIRIPSVNPIGNSADLSVCYEHRMSDWLEEFFRSIGAECERISVAEVAGVGAGGKPIVRQNVLAKYDAGPGRPTVLLDAHQDTVPVAGMKAAFDPQVRDGRMYGRGACDVKGGMSAMLAAFARLRSERPGSAASVVLSCSCDEEASALGVRDLVGYWSASTGPSKLLRDAPQACIVAEPTELDVVVMHPGVLRFRVRSEGMACHASDPSRGTNAIYAMRPVLEYFQILAEALREDSPSDPLCGSAAVSVGMIHGGTAVNIVPAECWIDVDRRMIPGEDPEQVWKQIECDLLKYKNVYCEAPWLAVPPLDDSVNGHVADAMLRAAEAAGAHGSRKLGVAYCTNASTVAAAGIPSIVFGPGSITHAHTNDEQIDLGQLDIAAQAYYDFCVDFGRYGA
ncbi:MAG: M20 family metallopeptidase [bacterium]|nr:M20 family metallopeptidase [bacterium]